MRLRVLLILLICSNVIAGDKVGGAGTSFVEDVNFSHEMALEVLLDVEVLLNVERNRFYQNYRADLIDELKGVAVKVNFNSSEKRRVYTEKKHGANIYIPANANAESSIKILTELILMSLASHMIESDYSTNEDFLEGLSRELISRSRLNF